eukprot:PhF_6_TR25813/c0_g1_i1/m.36433
MVHLTIPQFLTTYVFSSSSTNPPKITAPQQTILPTWKLTALQDRTLLFSRRRSFTIWEKWLRRRKGRTTVDTVQGKNIHILLNRYYVTFRYMVTWRKMRRGQVGKLDLMCSVLDGTILQRYFRKMNCLRLRRIYEKNKFNYVDLSLAASKMHLLRVYFEKLKDLEALRAARAAEARRIAQEVRVQVELQRARVESQRFVRVSRNQVQAVRANVGSRDVSPVVVAPLPAQGGPTTAIQRPASVSPGPVSQQPNTGNAINRPQTVQGQTTGVPAPGGGGQQQPAAVLMSPQRGTTTVGRASNRRLR